MDTTKLKKFAQFARRTLIAQVSARLDAVLDPASAARREHPKAVGDLEKAIKAADRDAVIERVAYTWFNRFSALRYMDVNNINGVRVVSPLPGAFQPEILADAKAGIIDDRVPEKTAKAIRDLLDGRAPSPDPQAEAYRALLVAICNHWHTSMPFMFEKIEDYTELLMPEDLLSNNSILAYTREAMTPDACQDVEIIGWLYQFYISEKKDEVFAGLKKNKKIEAENIPAATQLFTPHWIVRYLMENSLGRLWMLNHPQSNLTDKMEYYIAPVEPEEDFLRISSPEDIKICDPACGSGHMLTYAFDLLHAIYEEEGYDPSDIPSLILTHNLFGIEIDERAGALAAFALTMKARGRQRRFFRKSVRPNICVLQDVSFEAQELEDYTAQVGRDLFTSELRETLGQFAEAKNFGSLITPALKDVGEVARVVNAQDFEGNLFLRATHRRVQIVLRMADYLSPKYHVVVANPPYMGGKGMNGRLKAWAGKTFPDSKSDLFAMFMERALEMSVPHGMMAMINMQSWMFLSAYEKLRGILLSHANFLSMAHLGERAFDTIGGAVVSTTAFVLENSQNRFRMGDYIRLVDGNNEATKSEMLRLAASMAENANRYSASTESFENIPGSLIAYWLSERFSKNFSVLPRLGSVFTSREGLTTGSNDIFIRHWFEVSPKSSVFPDDEERNGRWHAYLKGGEYRRWAGNNEHLVDWEDAGARILNFSDPDTGRIRSHNYNGDWAKQPGITWSSVSGAEFSVRNVPGGFMFDTTGSMGFVEPDSDRSGVVAFLNSSVSSAYMKVLSPAIRFQPGHALNLPYDSMAASLAKDNAVHCISISKSDWDACETSWDFTTLPLLHTDTRQPTLATTYTALRQHWQQMTDEMQRLEEENNRIFIDAYGLQNELPPDVLPEEITLSCNPAYSVKGDLTDEAREKKLRERTMQEFLSYAVGCMFGRYSLDVPSLILANQGETLADYLARVPNPTFTPDEDNVIPVLEGDWFPDDITERFRRFLQVTFGDETLQDNLDFIEDALGKDIRKYFVRDFYADHVKRYKKRPIYWMFASPKGTFQALIYMHRYREDTVSVVLNDYLREFKLKLEGHRRAQEALSISPEASQSQRTKAIKEIEKVSKQITELEAWERDVLFPLASRKQPIDLDKGVKENYPLFGAALKKIVGVS
jgi:type II restriction/modification system DNA methylase subunit YeeA